MARTLTAVAIEAKLFSTHSFASGSIWGRLCLRNVHTGDVLHLCNVALPAMQHAFKSKFGRFCNLLREKCCNCVQQCSDICACRHDACNTIVQCSAGMFCASLFQSVCVSGANANRPLNAMNAVFVLINEK